MPRQRTPLDPKYGKLTVLNDPPEGLKVLVRCECGTEKHVLRSNLTSHRLSSCGAPTCRLRASSKSANPLPPKAVAALRLPAWLPPKDAPRLVQQLEAKAKPMFIAAHYGVHVQTIYNFLKTVRQAGGIERYMQAVRGELVVTNEVAGNPEVVVVERPTFATPGVLPPAPPPTYRP